MSQAERWASEEECMIFGDLLTPEERHAYIDGKLTDEEADKIAEARFKIIKANRQK